MKNRVKLTKRLIEEILPPAKGERTTLWDADVTGLGVRVYPTGKRTFFVQYRPGGGGRGVNSKDCTIGPYGAPWTPTTARAEARRLLALVAQGQDPQAEKRAAKKPKTPQRDRTFAGIAQEFMARHVERDLKPKTARDYRHVLDRHLLPAWGDRDAVGITPADVRDLIHGIEDGSLSMAGLTFRTASSVLGWAVDRGLIEANPCASVKAPAAPKARDRVLTDADIRLIWQACESLDWRFKAVVRLLLLTGQRRLETGLMRWTDIHRPENGPAEWIIPGDRAKNGKAHAVDLSPPALAVLGAIPATGSRYVLGDTGLGDTAGWSSAKRQIDRQAATLAADAGIDPPEPWRLHDLRRTAASGMAALGHPSGVIEKVLNHISGANSGLVAVYQHHDHREERRRALLDWGQRVADVVSIESGG